jgi:hypothetical protein
MVIAQDQFGTQKKRRSLLYQKKEFKDHNEQSPELTTTLKHLEFSGAKSEAFNQTGKPRKVR